VGTGFRKRSCSNNKIERDADSKKSHPALGESDVNLLRYRERVIDLNARYRAAIFLLDEADPRPDTRDAGSFYNQAPRMSAFEGDAYECKPVR
jgi:hypothetical protein